MQFGTLELSFFLCLASCSGARRRPNLIPIFSIVTFKNSACRGQDLLGWLLLDRGSAARVGTCYTAQECAAKGGAPSGNCAAGFGVCCLFLVNSGSVRQNCTYLQNPGFPSAYGDTGAVTYTVSKCDDTVCSLRLDFEQFAITGVSGTLEIVTAPAGNEAATAGGQCATDTLRLSNSQRDSYPTICGQNTGQHVYVDMGRELSDTATIIFSFTGDSTSRMWDIKATQVKCGHTSPPTGCFQWHAGLTGQLTSFNYIPTDETHLANQDYTICVRQEEGFCCVEYSVCSEDDNSGFTLNVDGIVRGLTNDNCNTYDRIIIEGSSFECSCGGSVTGYYHAHHCGRGVLTGHLQQAARSAPLCDCQAPFNVAIRTDALTDAGDVATPNAAHSRGLCLNWRLLPCC